MPIFLFSEIFDDSAVITSMSTSLAANVVGSGNALTYILYELALHPEIQQRVRNEVQSILRANEGVPTYDSLKKMTYCEMVINGSLSTPSTILLEINL